MHILNEAEFENYDLESINLRRFKIFNDNLLTFLNELSRIILSSKAAREYPDLITFGFFCRKGNLLNLKSNYSKELDNRFGYGLTLHIAPSNIPINFAFSLIFGMLAGNSNFVRLPSTYFPQCELLISLLSNQGLQVKYPEIYKSLVLFNSQRNSPKLLKLVERVQSLVVWGGDDTVKNFKNFQKNIACKELYFPNKVSSLLINGKAFLEAQSKQDIIRSFYNDTYLVDQNACSSPTNIYWFGDASIIEKAQKVFSKELIAYVCALKGLLPGHLIDKHLAVMSSIKNYQKSIKIEKLSNELWITRDSNLNPENFRLGIFNYISIDSINSIKSYQRINEQSLTYFGFEKEFLKDEFEQNNIFFDRVIPVGSALELTITWDGVDIIRHLSRSLSYK